MDEPWSGLELPLDFPFFPLPFALGGAPEDIEAELPAPAVPGDALESEDGAVPGVLEGGVVLASAGGGVEPSEALVASAAVLPDGAPGLALVPLASAGGVVGGAGVWAEF
jgi:hypothetical protein